MNLLKNYYYYFFFFFSISQFNPIGLYRNVPRKIRRMDGRYGQRSDPLVGRRRARWPLG